MPYLVELHEAFPQAVNLIPIDCSRVNSERTSMWGRGSQLVPWTMVSRTWLVLLPMMSRRCVV